MLSLSEWINVSCLFIVLFFAVLQDLKTQKIKNEVNVAGTVLGVFLAIVLPERDVLMSLLGVGVLFVAGLICWNLKFFRAGDAKLLCVVGAFVEWKMGLNILLIAVMCGAVIGLPFVIRRIIKKEKGLTKMPFSISIAVACIIGLRFGYLWDIISFL